MQPSIGILLRELARLYTQAQREQVTSGHDTSSTQSHVLMELGRAGLLTQHELGRRLSLDKGWVSRAVESLVQSGLVAKSRHENDRRSRWLQLTSKGATRYQALNESLDAHAEQLMQPLAPEQRASIYQALVLLLNGLQSALPQEATSAEVLPAAVPVEAVVIAKETVTIDSVEREPALALSEPVPEQAAAESTAASIADHAIIEARSIETSGHETSVTETPVTSSEPAAVEVEAPATPVRKSVADLRSSQSSARPGQPNAPTRILGSKTLPTRPLLSRTTPRTPLSRAAHSAEQKSPSAAVEHPVASVRTTPSHSHLQHDPQQSAQRPVVASSRPIAPSHVAPTHATPTASSKPLVRPVAATPVKPVITATHAPAHPPVHAAPSSDSRQNGLFHKLLSSQGSLFNKLLQRDQGPVENLAEETPAAEVEPADGLQFQPAFPGDWNEIRNLLTANRLPVQGALNHLSNFVVATDNGRVVGAIGLEIYGDIGLLRSLVVASNMRGRSIAKRLIKHMIERCREKQLSALYLLTGNADPLFEGYGFEKMPRADMPTKLYVSMELQGPSSTASTGMRLIL